MSPTIRILVADDHPVVREGLVAMLSTEPGFEVVGEAEDGDVAIARTRETTPHVLLLDLEMPGKDGIAVLQAVRELPDPPAVLVFTAFDTDERILSAVRAGARGYLLKGTPRRELFEAVRTVHEGGTTLQPVVASRLMQHMSEEESTEALTPREMEVLGLLAKGLPNREMAGVLSITERTVKFHVSAILAKLGAGNRTEAVSIAVNRGLVRL